MTSTPIGQPITVGRKPQDEGSVLGMISAGDARVGLALILLSSITGYLATGREESFGPVLVAFVITIFVTDERK